MIYYVSKNKQLFTIPNIISADIDVVVNFLDKNNVIGFDTETTGFDVYESELLCYQFGNRHNQFVVDQTSYPISLFKSYFENPDKLFLAQNFKFDGRFLLKHNIDIWKMKVYDTFLAECILTTGIDNRGLGLDDIVWKYCNVKLDKTVRGEINRIGMSSRVIKYAAENIFYFP